MDTRFQRKDGSILHVHLSSTPLNQDDISAGVVFTALDISERVEVGKNLREAYSIINQSKNVVFRWKNAEGWPVDYVSDNVVKLTGYTAHEFLSGEILYTQLIHPEDLERVRDEVMRAVRQEESREFSREPSQNKNKRE